ncbi:MAG: secretin N-terminal domain-containing protein [bacterium]
MTLIKRKPIVTWLMILVVTAMVTFLGDTPEVASSLAEEKISLDFKNADIDNVLTLLAHQNNLNLVMIDEIKGKRGSFYYAQISLKQALDYILTNAGFGYVFDGATRTVQISAARPTRDDTRIFQMKHADPMRVKRVLEEEISDMGRIMLERDTGSLIITDTFAHFNKIVELINALDMDTGKESSIGQLEITEQGKEMMTSVFVCQYVEATQLKTILESMKTETGTVEADPFSNSLIVRDSPRVVEKVIDLVKQLDRETPQVMIDAELVEITVGRMTDLGVRWFYAGKDGGLIGTLNYQYQTDPKPDDVENYGLASPAEGAALLFGEVSDEFRGIINALITDNKASLLANPRITVMNNQEAKIEITDRFPYQQVAGHDEHGNAEYTIEFLDIGIMLTVTPSIKTDMITLKLEPQVSYYLGENFGIPIQSMRKAITQVNVRNGKTIVIGGLISNKKSKTSYKVPVLGNLPLVGRLFRSDRDVVDKVELAIFVTPRVLGPMKMEKFSQEEKEKIERKNKQE